MSRTKREHHGEIWKSRQAKTWRLSPSKLAFQVSVRWLS
jgi:hypothetical protein